MPYNLVTPFGTSYGNMSQVDEANQQNQRQAGDWMFQQALANMSNQARMAEIAAQERMTGDYSARAANERAMQQAHDQTLQNISGLYSDRAANEQAIEGMRTAPAMTEALLRQREYDDQAPFRQAAVASLGPQSTIYGIINREIQNQYGGGQPGAAGAVGAPAASPGAAPMAGGAPAPAGDALHTLGPLAGILSILRGGQAPDIGGMDYLNQERARNMRIQAQTDAAPKIQALENAGNWDAAQKLGDSVGLPMSMDAGHFLQLPDVQLDLGNLMREANAANTYGDNTDHIANAKQILAQVQQKAMQRGASPDQVRAAIIAQLSQGPLAGKTSSLGKVYQNLAPWAWGRDTPSDNVDALREQLGLPTGTTSTF